MFRFAPLLIAAVIGAASIGGKVAPDGKSEIMTDLVDSQQMANVGGSDGSGLCVFTSFEHNARFQNVEALQGFRDWMRKYPGGGWPEKLDKKVKEYCAAKGVPVPKFVQAQGKASELMPVIEAALKSNRMVALTYDRSPSGRYGGRKIAHMVNCVYLDAKYACILDNNYIGTAKLEWMTRDDFTRYVMPGAGWIAILLDPGPPPLPWNERKSYEAVNGCVCPLGGCECCGCAMQRAKLSNTDACDCTPCRCDPCICGSSQRDRVRGIR